MDYIIAMIRAWAYADAQWFEFWMPQSGLLGGVIMAGYIVCILTLVHMLIESINARKERTPSPLPTT